MPQTTASGNEAAFRVAAWQPKAAELVAMLGNARLAEMMDANLALLVPFDLTIIVAYPQESRPILLHDGIRNRGSAEALAAYFRGAYLLDPFFSACVKPVPSGLYRMRDLAPDRFFEAEYSNSWEVHPCISMESGSLAEEIGYLFPLEDGSMAAYSLMRSNGSAEFDDQEFEALRLVEPMVRTLLARHFKPLQHADLGEPLHPTWSARGEAMELAFETFGAGALSRREQMVVKLVLQGHSAHSIAESLGIAEGTVKNHRKSIYARLSISSQQELFSLFIRHILG
jgi:DNA-binding CsgD family transcriptional regulator